ncbi:hypothetical protein ACI79P_21390 [Blastococcus sp. SYSU DS0510]
MLIALGFGVATSALLGPLALHQMQYRTSVTTLNQLLGGDAASLFVVAPLALVAGVLALRRHPVAPLLALGPALYVIYMFAQLVIGQEYLRLPGNVERFFPLLLAVFVLGEAAVVLAWGAVPAGLPRLSHRLERIAGVALILVALFLVFGLHLRPIVTAWQDPSSLTEYASSPTAFWMVKLMDLGIVVPAALATGIGVLRGVPWARRAMYAMLTGYTCLAIAVAAMGVVMYANDDPDASLGLAGGFVMFALLFATVTVLLYRPLFALARSLRDGPAGPRDVTVDSVTTTVGNG